MYTGGGGGLLSLLILVDIALAVGAKLRVIVNENFFFSIIVKIMIILVEIALVVGAKLRVITSTIFRCCDRSS